MAPAAAQDILSSLRERIARIEGVLPQPLETTGTAGDEAGRCRAARLSTGIDRLDAAIDGGVPMAGLVEIHAPATRDAGSSAGLSLAFSRLLRRAGKAGPLLWIATSEIFREAGRPYAPGLCTRFGLDPHDLLVVETARLEQSLWIAEEAAGLGLFLAINLEMRGSHRSLDLTATRRLHRRALAGRHPLFLLRQAGRPEPTAAPLRLNVASAPAGLRGLHGGPLAGSIGPPAFSVTVAKNSTAIPAAFTLEWTHDAFSERSLFAAANSRAVVSLPAERTPASASIRTVVAFRDADGRTDAGPEPAPGQHPAHRRAGGQG